MKKSLCAIGCAALVSASAAFAGEGMFSDYLPSGWTADVVAAVKFTRMDYHNWQEGGTSASTWLFTYDADIKRSWEVVDWRNKVNLALGQTWTDGYGRRKSDDKIFIETMGDFNTSEKIKPYIGARFESQFMKTYEYSEDAEGNEIRKDVACFMDPAYITQMAGVGFFPAEDLRVGRYSSVWFSTRLGFANRMTVSNGYGFADDPDTKKFEKFKDEPGLESITEFKYSLEGLVTFKSRLWAFVNFKGVDEIDGKWENLLTVAFAPLFEFQFGFDMAYDKDLDKDAQSKSMILVGVTWRWF